MDRPGSRFRVLNVHVLHIVDTVSRAPCRRPAIDKNVALIDLSAGRSHNQIQIIDQSFGCRSRTGIVGPDQSDLEGGARGPHGIGITHGAARVQAIGAVDELGRAIGGSSHIDPSPAFVVVGDGIGVVVDAIVVFVQHVHRGIDEGGFDQGGAGVMIVGFLVEVAHHRGRTRGQGVGHGGAAHVLVVLVVGISPTVVLPGIVLGVRLGIIALLVHVGIARKDEGAWGHHIGLDAAIVGGTTTGKARHLLGVACQGIAGNGVCGEVVGPGLVIGEDVVHAILGCAIGVIQAGVAGVAILALIFRSPYTEDVLGCGRGAHGIFIYVAIAIAILPIIASREGDEHIGMIPHEIIRIDCVIGVCTGLRAAPGVGVDASTRIIGLLEEVPDVIR